MNENDPTPEDLKKFISDHECILTIPREEIQAICKQLPLSCLINSPNISKDGMKLLHIMCESFCIDWVTGNLSAKWYSDKTLPMPDYFEKIEMQKKEYSHGKEYWDFVDPGYVDDTRSDPDWKPRKRQKK